MKITCKKIWASDDPVSSTGYLTALNLNFSSISQDPPSMMYFSGQSWWSEKFL